MNVAMLDDYQAWTVKTSVYSGVGTGDFSAIAYACIGLVGECGEFQDAGIATPAATTTDSFIGLTKEAGDVMFIEQRREWLTKEAGDVMFYVARLCAELGLSLGFVWRARGPEGLLLSTTLLVRVGRVAEAVKKHLRGDYDRAECARRAGDAISRVLFDIEESLDYYGVGLADVLSQNRAKLEARLAKGTIRGSGEER